jgi:hypothetical protein
MAKINLEHTTTLSADETYNKIKGLIEENKDLQSIDKNYTYELNDASRSANAKGKGFEAQLSVTESGEGSKVEFSIKVGLMLSPFKGVIEEKLKSRLTKVLA